MQATKEYVGMGPGGMCVCTNCGYSQPHLRGVPCTEVSCPKCGTKLIREGTSDRS